ncbi:uncharacterized protein EI97DRAFT_429963 [Westerdykella ornata]|uniref:F-box domain-containing protein n=1 Tax=Westerdykella ornata TaxID=318751 RepID=A0A6A6JVE0_WESOR|nr:uncharacterized protein EI97DRAFT_429963 [Westerdykella ornata]KAF2280205.1 hypothetical protein EI97DRAFT_429963 [Westerdykella ornata]
MSQLHDAPSQRPPGGLTEPLPSCEPGIQGRVVSLEGPSPTGEGLPVDDWITRFRKADSSSRRCLLFALIPELTASECNDLRNYRRTDIIGRLPLELVLAVFSHLDVASSFRLQTVSKRWRDKLLSPAFFNQQQRQWYGCDYVYAPISQQEDHLTRQRNEAERIHRICTGRPIERFLLPAMIHSTVEWSFLFCNDTLYWIHTPPGPGPPAHGRTVLSCNIYTGAMQQFQLPTRERINFVAVSDELLLMSARKGWYHITNLSDERKKHFRIPATLGYSYENVECQGRRVIVSRMYDTDCVVWAYIWHFDTGRGEIVKVKLADDFHDPVGSLLVPIVMSDLNRIVTFPVTPGTQNIAPGQPTESARAYDMKGVRLETIACSDDRPVCIRCFGSYCKSPPPGTNSQPLPFLPTVSNANILRLLGPCVRIATYGHSHDLRHGPTQTNPCRFTCCLGTPTSPTHKEFPCVPPSAPDAGLNLARSRPSVPTSTYMCCDDDTVIVMWPSRDNDLWTLEFLCFNKEKRLHREGLQAAVDRTMGIVGSSGV